MPRGSFTDQVGHVIDLAATALEVAGVAYPERYGGRVVTPIEGKSLVPILRGGKREGHGALFWEHEGAAAVRRGALKLVRVGADAPWELYDLSADRTELHDLGAAHPEVVAELAALWHAWSERVHVYPKRGAE